MPYEVRFTKRIPIVDRGQYFNDCCIGGDVVSDHLLPSIRARYTSIQENQEDWGWFIWFRKGGVRLGIDIYTDDPDTGAFRLLLTSSIKRLLVVDSAVDTVELDELRDLVASQLAGWTDDALTVARVEPE